jgi:WD40 repeat protein
VRLLSLSLTLCLVLASTLAASASPAPASLPQLVVQGGHNLAVNFLAFAADDEALVSTGDDGDARVWEAGSGLLLRVFPVAPRWELRAATLSPDGRTLVTASRHDGIARWDITDGRQLDRVSLPFEIGAAAFSGDGKWLAVREAEGTALRIVDARNGSTRQVIAPRDGKITGFALSADGALLAMATSDGIAVHELRRGRLLYTVPGHGGAYTALLFHRELLVSGGKDGQLRWHRARGGEQIDAQQLASTVLGLTACGDEQVMVIELVQRRVGLHRPRTAPRTLPVPDGVAPGAAAATSKDLRRVAVADYARVHILDTASGQELARTPDQATHGIEWLPDGDLLLSANGRLLVTNRGKGRARFFDLHAGRVANTGEPMGRYIAALAVEPDGGLVHAAGGDNRLYTWSALATTTSVVDLDERGLSILDLAISRDSGHLLMAFENGEPSSLLVLSKLAGADQANQPMVRLSGHDEPPLMAVALSPDGRHVAARGLALMLWDASRPTQPRELFVPGEDTVGPVLAFSPDGALLATADTVLRLWDVAGGTLLRSWPLPEQAMSVAFAPDGNSLAVADGTVTFWRVADGARIGQIARRDGRELTSAWLPDGKRLFTLGDDNVVRLWQADKGTLLALLAGTEDGNWVVATPDGRFDMGDIEAPAGLHWVMPDDPLRTLPLSIFLRDYFTPGLLREVLDGTPAPARALPASARRAVPAVRIVATALSDDRQHLDVDVEISATRHVPGPFARARDRRESGARDLHLQLDGRLVASDDLAFADVRVGQPLSRRFRVALPSPRTWSDDPLDEFTLSAYAFNADGIKGETTVRHVQVPSDRPRRQPRVYIVSVGVNRHENPAWDLRFAANDARLFQQVLTEKLTSPHNGDLPPDLEVVAVPIISDEHTEQAGKAMLHMVLARLGGMPLDSRVRTLPNGDRLQPATPDDTLILTFAGHGFADGSGEFHLVMPETGPGEGKQVTDQLRRNSVSGEELSSWLRRIDAGDMSLILDACHSAASIDAGNFRAGPMGARGLGQLAWDKRMRVLAGSQADAFALEDASLQHGLLSYMLVREGLESGGAKYDDGQYTGYVYLSAWLRFAVSAVPEMAGRLHQDYITLPHSRGIERRIRVVGARGGNRAVQQPVVFDFSGPGRSSYRPMLSLDCDPALCADYSGPEEAEPEESTPEDARPE